MHTAPSDASQHLDLFESHRPFFSHRSFCRKGASAFGASCRSLVHPPHLESRLSRLKSWESVTRSSMHFVLFGIVPTFDCTSLTRLSLAGAVRLGSFEEKARKARQGKARQGLGKRSLPRDGKVRSAALRLLSEGSSICCQLPWPTYALSTPPGNVVVTVAGAFVAPLSVG